MLTDARRGVALGVLGGFVISFDVPMIRLAGADAWTSMVIRGAFLFLLFLPLILREVRNARAEGRRFVDRAWIEVGIFYGLSNILFALSVFTTTTANLVFILAFSSMIAALLAWWLIGEKPRPATWAAIAATLFGVAIIVGGNLGSGSVGDLFALATALTLALALVRSRMAARDMSLAPGLGGLIAAAAGLVPALLWGQWPEAPAWLFANALFTVPLAAWCLALAPRYVSAPQVAMFYLIETVLAPVWVWIAYGEEITAATFAGGAIILSALAIHSLWSMWRGGGTANPKEGLQQAGAG